MLGKNIHKVIENVGIDKVHVSILHRIQIVLHLQTAISLHDIGCARQPKVSHVFLHIIGQGDNKCGSDAFERLREHVVGVEPAELRFEPCLRPDLPARHLQRHGVGHLGRRREVAAGLDIRRVLHLAGPALFAQHAQDIGFPDGLVSQSRGIGLEANLAPTGAIGTDDGIHVDMSALTSRQCGEQQDCRKKCFFHNVIDLLMSEKLVLERFISTNWRRASRGGRLTSVGE